MPGRPEDYAWCEKILQDQDRDNWLAALFVPASARPHIHAIRAFAHEIARVRDIVRQPQLGEIRLQWWREVLEGGREGEASRNPVSAAILSTIDTIGLPRAAFVNLLEARRFDLYQDPMPTLNDLEGWCGETHSVLFQLAALVLSGGEAAAEACGHAGVAQGLANVLQELPAHVARGQCYLPVDLLARHGVTAAQAAAGMELPGLATAIKEIRDVAQAHLQRARNCIADLPAVLHPVFVPLAVTELQLKASAGSGNRTFRETPRTSRWRKMWAMWRWH